LEHRKQRSSPARLREGVHIQPPPSMTPRRFPSPRRADKVSGGYVVRDANEQALAYIYLRDNATESLQAKMLTKDEARRIAINVAPLPELLGKADRG
jgi:hypothetical protein